MTLFQIALGNIRRRTAKTLFVLLGLAIGIATIVSVYSVLETMKTDMTRQMTDYGANVLITADTGELAFSYGGISIPGVLYEFKQLTVQDVRALDRLPSRAQVRAIVPRLLGAVSSNVGDVVISGSLLKDEFTLKPWLRLQRAPDPVAGEGNAETGGGFWDAPSKRGSSRNLSGSTTGSVDGSNVAGGNAAAGAAGADAGMAGEKLDLEREDLSSVILQQREVILGASVADELGLAMNDVIELKGRTFVVRGILQENGSPEDNQVMMTLNAAQSLLGQPDAVTAIDLAVNYSTGSEASFLQQVQALLPGVKVTGLRQAVLERDSVLIRLTRFGTAVAILVLLVGMLASGLSMSAAVKERTREIGIFRAIGFRQSHIRTIIMIEGIMVSLIGGVAGYAAGTLLARAAAPVLVGNSLDVRWNPIVLAGAVLLALVIGTLASAFPARQAARLDPAEALIAL